MYIEEQIVDLRKKVIELEIQINKLTSLYMHQGSKIYNNDVEIESKDSDIVLTVKEVSKILKTNTAYIYELIRIGKLPALKLGSIKVRKQALIRFLNEYEGFDLSDINDIKELHHL
jgi:excisionase family DNA binding protein